MRAQVCSGDCRRLCMRPLHERTPMRFSPLVDRIAGKGAAAWRIHYEAQRRRAAGQDVILLTVGDPDQAPPPILIAETIAALEHRRTRYSPTIGQADLRAAVAARVARRSG